MSHSNSSLNCFTACERKYYYAYVKQVKPDVPPSPHLTFGTMAHEVLEKAGNLRDNCDAGIPDYNICIPSELQYPELKNYFGIKNWQVYFTLVCKQVAEYERELCKEYNNPTIEREIKLSLTPTELYNRKYLYEGEATQPLVGVVDLLIRTDKAATIVDYKFSTKKKTQDDFDMNSQLYLYAMLVHEIYNIPLREIKIAYIDIPKQDFAMPILLTNGTLSRAKNQNTLQSMYITAIQALHPDNWQQQITEGGYYHDIVNELALNKAAYLQSQYLDMDAYNHIIPELFDVIRHIEIINKYNLRWLTRFDAYTCKSCEYMHSCKTWLNLNKEDTI